MNVDSAEILVGKRTGARKPHNSGQTPSNVDVDCAMWLLACYRLVYVLWVAATGIRVPRPHPMTNLRIGAPSSARIACRPVRVIDDKETVHVRPVPRFDKPAAWDAQPLGARMARVEM